MSAQQRSIRLTIDSRLENIPLVGMAANRICKAAGLGEIERYQIELCLVEAVTNCVVHAYGRRPGHPVEVDLELDAGAVRILVSDYGVPLERFAPEPPQLDPQDRESLPEGGMGLFIMDSVMSACSYRAEHGRNTLELVKRLQSPAAPRPAAGGGAPEPPPGAPPAADPAPSSPD